MVTIANGKRNATTDGPVVKKDKRYKNPTPNMFLRYQYLSLESYLHSFQSTPPLLFYLSILTNKTDIML